MRLIFLTNITSFYQLLKSEGGESFAWHFLIAKIAISIFVQFILLGNILPSCSRTGGKKHNLVSLLFIVNLFSVPWFIYFSVFFYTLLFLFLNLKWVSHLKEISWILLVLSSFEKWGGGNILCTVFAYSRKRSLDPCLFYFAWKQSHYLFKDKRWVTSPF